MKKIPTVLVRNPDDRAHVTDEITFGCAWVFAGVGVATRKYDGTCVMLDVDGKWWARREVKPGKEFPPNYVIEDHDALTGKWQGWEPIEQSAFAKFHKEATTLFPGRSDFTSGTYELIGPKINGNPERVDVHSLIEHADADRIETHVSHTVEEIKGIVAGVGARGWEGVVWHHPDGRMAKLKARDLRLAAGGVVLGDHPLVMVGERGHEQLMRIPASPDIRQGDQHGNLR